MVNSKVQFSLNLVIPDKQVHVSGKLVSEIYWFIKYVIYVATTLGVICKKMLFDDFDQ